MGDGRSVRVGDRTALILDIFQQRAATREGQLQVELASVEYQLPRLTRMWSHLDRVGGGGLVKGTGAAGAFYSSLISEWPACMLNLHSLHAKHHYRL